MYKIRGKPFYESRGFMSYPNVYARIIRAENIQLKDVDPENQTARYKYYDISLDKCSCQDFLKRLSPCKHMFALAFELKKLDKLPKLIDLQRDIFNQEYQNLEDEELLFLLDFLQECTHSNSPFIMKAKGETPPMLLYLGLLEEIYFEHEFNKFFSLIGLNEYILHNLNECIFKITKQKLRS